MKRKNVLKAIVRDAQLVLNFNGTGDVTMEEAEALTPDLIFVMGMHEIRTLVTAARYIARVFPNTRIVISGGGSGRGSWLLRQAVIRHCLLYGRPLPTKDESRSEARLVRKLLIEEGVSPDSIRECDLEEDALHSAANWTLGIPIFRKNGELQESGLILVVQSPCNRRRAGASGVRILGSVGLRDVKVWTLHIPPTDLNSLGESDQFIELLRSLGLRAQPASEFRICRQFEPTVIEQMPVPLRYLAEDVERRWHALLERSPRLMDHFIEAVLNTGPEVGGPQSPTAP